MSESKQYKLIADVTLQAGDQVLMVKYADTNSYDMQPGWFLPNNLIHFGEDPTEAISRIAKEQLGLQALQPKIHHVESFIGRDKSWHLVFHFVATFNQIPELKPDEKEIKSAQWFSSDKLPDAKEVAHHGWAIATLRNILPASGR